MILLHAVNAILVVMSIVVLVPITTFTVECLAAVLRRKTLSRSEDARRREQPY